MKTPCANSPPRDDLAVAVARLLLAHLRDPLQSLLEKERRAVAEAIASVSNDVAASSRGREEIAYHKGREDQAAGAPCPYCSDGDEPEFEIESNPTLH